MPTGLVIRNEISCRPPSSVTRITVIGNEMHLFLKVAE